MSTMSYKRYMYSYAYIYTCIICEANFRVKTTTFFKFYEEVPQHELFCTAFYYGKKECANEPTSNCGILARRKVQHQGHRVAYTHTECCMAPLARRCIATGYAGLAVDIPKGHGERDVHQVHHLCRFWNKRFLRRTKKKEGDGEAFRCIQTVAPLISNRTTTNINSG